VLRARSRWIQRTVCHPSSMLISIRSPSRLPASEQRGHGK
jgi:hypothetical protein